MIPVYLSVAFLYPGLTMERPKSALSALSDDTVTESPVITNHDPHPYVYEFLGSSKVVYLVDRCERANARDITDPDDEDWESAKSGPLRVVDGKLAETLFVITGLIEVETFVGSSLSGPWLEDYFNDGNWGDFDEDTLDAIFQDARKMHEFQPCRHNDEFDGASKFDEVSFLTLWQPQMGGSYEYGPELDYVEYVGPGTVVPVRDEAPDQPPLSDLL